METYQNVDMGKTPFACYFNFKVGPKRCYLSGVAFGEFVNQIIIQNRSTMLFKISLSSSINENLCSIVSKIHEEIFF